MVKQMLILKEKVALELERYTICPNRITESDNQIVNTLYGAFNDIGTIVDSGWYFSFIADHAKVFKEASLMPLYSAYEIAITEVILESKSSGKQLIVLEEISEIQNRVWAAIMENIERVNWYLDGGKIIYKGRWK